ncbi:ATP-binding protein [Thalassospiraceae bacterium LMO-JJ14]|nr:ATP-binding protein [Thalassospiraceae bacterium LMO-JJ14]
MPGDRWLPINYETSEGIVFRKLVSFGDHWQIYDSGRGARVLVCEKMIGERWISEGFLDESALTSFSFGQNNFFAIESGQNQQLAAVTEFITPETKADAAAFAVSLRHTRQIDHEVSLHDAIFVERFSRLLPTWTVSEKISDDHVLGRWLTGGVSVSTSSFRRISNLLGWLKKDEVLDVIALGGLPLPDGGVRTEGNTRSKEAQQNKDAETRKSKTDSATILKEPSSNSPSEFKLSGRPFLEDFFNEHVVDIILHEDRYRALGVDFPSAVVLHGPPGCGKTFAVDRLVEYLDWPVYHVDSNSVGSPYIHETSRKVAEIFETAIENAPAVIVIDEMESFLSDRQLHQSTGLHHVEEVAEFLRRIPEAISRRVLIIGMTNRLEMIDPAILRRGRFDHVIEVGMPTRSEVADLVSSLLEKMPVAGEVSVEKAISALTGRPLSDVAFSIREAGRLAARSGKDKLSQDALDQAIARLPNVSDEEKSRPIGFIWD